MFSFLILSKSFADDDEKSILSLQHSFQIEIESCLAFCYSTSMGVVYSLGQETSTLE